VQLSPVEMQALAREAMAKGDASRGEFIFRRPELACVTCHAVGGAGGKLGPDLTSIGASAPGDYLIEALLYPGAKIKEGYHSVLIATKDGQEHSGMITKETGNEIVLRTADNQDVSIPAGNVARRTSVGSLMPAGLIDALLPEERLDLFKFLSQLGKPGDFDAAKGGVAREWKLYLVLSANEHLGVERVVAGDFSLKDWTPAFSLARGALPREAIEAAYPNRSNNRGLFAATQFESAKGGTAKFVVAGDVKAIFVNGKVVRAATDFRTEVNPGVITIVLHLEVVTPTDVTLKSNDVVFGLK
jgi:putative heme-binding domain-containing protein